MKKIINVVRAKKKFFERLAIYRTGIYDRYPRVSRDGLRTCYKRGEYDGMKLYGDKVSLIPITDEDTPYITTWRNTQEVRKNFVFQVDFTNEIHERWMKEYIATGKAIQFIIRMRADGFPVGSVYLRDIDQKNKKAEFGIFIGDNHMRGKGIGSESARLICKFGFEELGLHKIFLRVFADNERAIKSYEASGFVKEGYFRDEILDEAGYRDMVFMALYNMDDTK